MHVDGARIADHLDARPSPPAGSEELSGPRNPVPYGYSLYQIYRFYDTQSLDLIVLTVFDLFVMVLIWHEYGLMRRHHLVPPRTAI